MNWKQVMQREKYRRGSGGGGGGGDGGGSGRVLHHPSALSSCFLW